MDVFWFLIFKPHLPAVLQSVKAKLKLASHESPNQLAVLALTFLLAAIQASFWQSLPQKKTCGSMLQDALTPTKNPRRNKMLLAKTLGNLLGFFLGGANCWRHPIRHLRLEFHHLAKLLYFTSLDFPEIQGFPCQKATEIGDRRVRSRANLSRWISSVVNSYFVAKKHTHLLYWYETFGKINTICAKV